MASHPPLAGSSKAAHTVLGVVSIGDLVQAR
jgi:hypothetical protein